MEYSNQIFVTKTFTLTLETVGKIADLATRLGEKKSKIIRIAIDELFESLNEIEELPEQEE